MQKKVKIFGKMITLNMRNDGDYAIAHELFLDHQYKHCDEVIRKSEDAIIDIGGHLGFFSLYASLLNPKVPIYSFEPHNGNFELLKRNLKDNRVKNVVPWNLAVSNKEGPINLLLSKEDLNHSTVKAIESTGEVQKTQATTLEKIFDRHQIGHCDLLKIDCEGAEFAILEDMPKSVYDRVSNIFLEYHDWVPGKNPNSKMPELGFLWCQSKQA